MLASLLACLLAGTLDSPSAHARTLYVNAAYGGWFEDGSPSYPFKTVQRAVTAAVNGDVLVIVAGEYREIVTVDKAVQLLASGGTVTIGRNPSNPWGRLANPGFEGEAIRTTLFFPGLPLDGSGSADPEHPYFNGCGPSANGTWCYSRHPTDPRHLQWVDAQIPVSAANRDFALQSIVDAGFNVLSMSTWGESGLPCTVSCQNLEVCQQEHRCYQPATGDWECRIGWYGAANMQVSATAKDQLFDAAVGKPLLIVPFIESRFGSDWDFHDDFPNAPDGQVAPGLVSQLNNLIYRYVLQPANPAWPAHWARVYDRSGQPRYAIAIVQASSAVIDPADPQADAKFAAGFDAVAQKVLEATGQMVGFFLDPIARNPTSTFDCLPAADLSQLQSTYGPDPPPAPPRPWFKPDPSTTGPALMLQASILGIQCFSPEGWIDYQPGLGKSVNQCFKLAWKQDFSLRWYNSGIPFLQDVTAGYDGHLLFASRPAEHGGLTVWGFDDAWRAGLSQLVASYGQNGMVYNAWNGYCEGLAGMPTTEESGLTPPFPSYTWMTTLTAMY